MIFDEDDIEGTDEKKLILALGQMPSEALVQRIIAYRFLGMYKSLAQMSMLELSRRRSLGEEYLFECQIENEIKKLKEIK